MSDDKKQKNEKPRVRFTDGANSTALQQIMDDEDDQQLLQNLVHERRAVRRRPRIRSAPCTIEIETDNDVPDTIRGRDGNLYPKVPWRSLAERFMKELLNNPPPTCTRTRAPVVTSSEESSPEDKNDSSEDDPAFCGYGKLE